MINLLAILLSMAMMLTGVPADSLPEGGALEAPAARTLTVSDLTLSVNGESVTLNPAAHFGVMTDGAQAVYDFYVESEGQHLLPLQLVADETGLLVYNDGSDTTLSLSAEELNALMEQAGALSFDTGMSEQDAKILQFMKDEYVPAVVGVMKMLKDNEALADFQAAVDANTQPLFETWRGEGVDAEIEYDGSTYSGKVYTYALEPEQFGELVDVEFDSTEETRAFTEMFIKFLDLIEEMDESAELPEAFRNIESFGQVYTTLGLRADVVEQIAEGLSIADVTFTCAIPGTDITMTFPVHAVECGDYRESSADFSMTYEGITMAYTVSATQTPISMDMIMDVEVTPAVEAAEPVVDYETEAPAESKAGISAAVSSAVSKVVSDTSAKAEEAEVPAAVEPLASMRLSAHEDTDEYGNSTFNMMMNAVAGENAGNTSVGFTANGTKAADGSSCNVYVSADVRNAYQTINASFTADGAMTEDGAFATDVSVFVTDNSTTEVSVGCTLTTDSTPFDVRAKADKAVSVMSLEEPPMGLVMSLGADVMNLGKDESVQQLASMFGIAGGPEIEYDTDEAYANDEYQDDDYDDEEDEDIPEDDGVLPFGIPQFAWLPEGYTVVDLDIDTRYDNVDVTIYNNDTYDMMSVFFQGYDEKQSVACYLADGDGSASQYDGRIIYVNDYDGYRSYTSGDDRVYISTYADQLSTEDVVKILSNVKY